MSLLFEALQTLTPPERKAFSRLLHTPFFNTKDSLAEYGDYLLECAASRSTPDDEQMYSIAAKSKVTSREQSLRLANSALLQLLETWLAYREFVEQTDQQKINLARAYRKRSLTRHYKIIHREARAQVNEKPLRNVSWLEHTFQLEWEQYQFEVAAQRSAELNIQNCSDAMDAAFMANKLRLACLAISHQAIYKTDYQIHYLPEVMARLESEEALLTNPALGLYYHCYRFLTQSDGAAHFTTFRTLLPGASAQFPEEELRLLYLLAINYGIKEINRSAAGAIENTFDLYKGALQHDLLLENGLISRFAFSNIVAIALRAGNMDWVENFIETYRPRLERQWREAITSLSMARLEYERHQYEAALLHLQRADYKDTMNNLSARILMMKIYFETGALDALDSHLKNLKNYIKRHTAIGYHRNNYTNIVYFTEQLTLVNPLDKKAVEQLRAAIAQEKVLTEKEWLLKQL